MSLKEWARESLRKFFTLLEFDPREQPAEESARVPTRGLLLNRVGEVFLAGGDGVPLGTIDMGDDLVAEKLWNALIRDMDHRIVGNGAGKLTARGAIDAFSVDRMREASVFLFRKPFDRNLTEEQVEMYRSWLLQLREF